MGWKCATSTDVCRASPVRCPALSSAGHGYLRQTRNGHMLRHLPRETLLYLPEKNRVLYVLHGILQLPTAFAPASSGDF